MIRLALLASVAVLPLALAAQGTDTGTGTDSATGGNGVAADAATDPLAEAVEGTDPLSEAATDPVATPDGGERDQWASLGIAPHSPKVTRYRQMLRRAQEGPRG